MSEEQIKENLNVYLYEIIGTSKHNENGEILMIYKPLYETDCVKGIDYAARPYKIFMSEVDHEKYPEIKQNIVLNLKNKV